MSQKALPACGRAPVERLAIVKLVADLEADHAALRRQLLQQRVRHVAWNVVDGAQAVMRGDDRVGAGVDGCEMASSEAWETLITMPSRFISRITSRPRSFSPCHFGVRAAGVGIIAGPVVRGELHRTQAQAVHLADDGRVAIQIEAAFDVEHGGDFAAGVNALDVRRVAGEFDASGCCGRSARWRNPACAAPAWFRGGRDSSLRSRRWKRTARRGRLLWRAADRTGRPALRWPISPP